MDQQVDLALTLFEGENTEEKLAGTKRVVTKNISHFSVESLNNALKYFEAEEKKFYCQLLKDA